MHLHVGRLGALSAALGIGLALAATAAPAALADSPGTADSSANSARANAAAHRAGTPHAATAQAAAVVGRQNAPVARTTNSSVATHLVAAALPAPAAATANAGQSANTTQSTLKVRKSTLQGPVRLRRGSTDAAELSGVAYASGDTYYSVGDNGAASIWQLAAAVNSRTGRIGSAVVSGGISAPALGRDSEGIALTPDLAKAWVSDEIASTITQFSLANGLMLSSVAVPSIYRPANVQGNFGLESLAFGASTLWTANEEALKSDGSLSTTKTGSWVRIQQFGGEGLSPGVQYAYQTDPIKAMSPFTTAERSGLVDVVALPNGQVLTLERELGGFLPTFRSRIYLIDPTGATDVSALPSLADGGFTAVSKKRLWQGNFNFANFEGITLGPQLKDGSYSLLLVSDDGQGQMGQRQTMLSLTLKGL